jgi:agmatinase
MVRTIRRFGSLGRFEITPESSLHMNDQSSIEQPAFLGVEPPSGPPAAVVLPIPYDGTSTWRKGADRGPQALLEASTEVELFDLPTQTEPSLAGIETRAALEYRGAPEELVERVRVMVAEVLEGGAIPIVLGGEHSVSIGAIHAASALIESRGRRLGVVQIDAHGDTRESYHGSACNHACVMARAREVADIVQIGIRAIDRCEHETMDLTRVFPAHEILAAKDDGWMDQAIELMPEDVYLTIDLDAFDSGVMPATGTPEPGGLDWTIVNTFVSRLSARRNIFAFDVVELLPHPAHWACDFLAAKLVHRVLAEILVARSDPH